MRSDHSRRRARIASSAGRNAAATCSTGCAAVLRGRIEAELTSGGLLSRPGTSARASVGAACSAVADGDGAAGPSRMPRPVSANLPLACGAKMHERDRPVRSRSPNLLPLQAGFQSLRFPSLKRKQSARDLAERPRGQLRVCGEVVPDATREGHDPLPDRHIRNHAIDEMRAGVVHSTRGARRADSAALARERDQVARRDSHGRRPLRSPGGAGRTQGSPPVPCRRSSAARCRRGSRWPGRSAAHQARRLRRGTGAWPRARGGDRACGPSGP